MAYALVFAIPANIKKTLRKDRCRSGSFMDIRSKLADLVSRGQVASGPSDLASYQRDFASKQPVLQSPHW
jgi:hypothetical protein